MLSRSTRRLTLAIVLLAALLLAPLGQAKPPVANRDAPDSTGGQEISDLDIDPTGRFATAVVVYDTSKVIQAPGGGLIPGTSPTNTHKDVFVCDFGPANLPRSGSGCRGINHASTSSSNPAQSVDVTSFSGTSGLTPVYAVGGPGESLSYWFHSSDTARFTKTLSGPVTNVSVSPDGARVVAGVTPTSVGSAGKVVVYGSDGELKWELDLADRQGNPARPTSLAFSGDGKVLVVGTNRGLLFLDVYGAKPTSLVQSAAPIDTTGAVTKVLVSRTGNAAVAGTTDGIYYVPLVGYRPQSGATWNRGVTDGVSDVAMSLDGERFAAASGSRIHFYRHLEGPLVAEQLPQSHDAGARVNDLAYDSTGSLLVAVAGESVLGFGPVKSTPLWSFKATEAARGALDLPLRKVAMSESGERFVVAGRTKLMAYTNVVSAAATFGNAGPVSVVPATPLHTAFTVTNTGSLPDNYTFVVKAPVSWSATSPANLALDPDQSAPVNLTVEAPPGTAPGVYPLTVELRSRAAGGTLVSTAHLNLSLPRAVALALETQDEKVLLRQGADATVTFTVRNLGNAEGVVNLSAAQSASDGSSWGARFSQDQVRVAPGASADVDLVLTAPAQGASGARNVVTVRAREGDAEAVRVVTAYVNAQFGAEVAAANSSLEFKPGDSRTLAVTIRNTGNTEDTFNVTYTLTPAIAGSDWKVTLAEDLKVTLAQGASKTVSVVIRPAVAEPRDASLTLRAVSQGSPALVENSAVVVLAARPMDATPTEDEGNPLPAPSPLALLAVVAVAALVARRGGLR